jgi:hypothetical protein
MNAHDFGHPWHHYIDRIDTRIKHFHGRGIFPRHENQMEFQGIKDQVAVGIGPLFYEQDYVEKGKPDPSLKRDLRFTAERVLVISHNAPKSYRKGLRAVFQEIFVLG